jgi:alpha-mannosidase
LLGQRYFQSRFGKIATVGYNIDSFGHNANLPQLLRKAGLASYVFMRPGEDEKPLPSALFEWEAPSGDRVTAYRLPLHYSNHEQSTREKLEALPHLLHYRADHPWMIFYGVGNHGGGSSIAELTDIVRLLEERDDLAFSDPEIFFASLNYEMDSGSSALPVVHGEMQPHAIGCYSAHSEMKQLHRRTERMLLTAERIQVLAALTAPPPSLRLLTAEAELTQAWKNLCFNQFHDLLGGVAIREACDDAISMYREALSIAERNIRSRIQQLAARIDTSNYVQNIIVFNPAAHEREETIEFELWQPEEYGEEKPLPGVMLVDPDGARIPTQRIESSGKIGNDRARFLAKVPIPAFGWSVFGIERSPNKATETQHDVKLPFSHTPAIIVRDGSDTWGHGLTSFTDYEAPFHIDTTEIIERGPIRNGIRIISSGGASRMEEEIFFEQDSPVIELRVFLDWREQHRMLKLRFRHGCSDPVAHYEIPYAWIERPIGPQEWPGQSWVNVSERDGSHGLAIVTDSKYSYSVDEEYIYVVAARSPLYAHHVPPHAMQEGERERYQDQGEQEFRLMLLPHNGNWSGTHLARFEMPLIVHHASGHDGTLLKTFAGFERKSTAIHVGAIKMAEVGDGIILRAAEQAGEASEAEFQFPSHSATWMASFAPFEIKSFLIRNGHATEIDFLERPI